MSIVFPRCKDLMAIALLNHSIHLSVPLSCKSPLTLPHATDISISHLCHLHLVYRLNDVPASSLSKAALARVDTERLAVASRRGTVEDRALIETIVRNAEAHASTVGRLETSLTASRRILRLRSEGVESESGAVGVRGSDSAVLNEILRYACSGLGDRGRCRGRGGRGAAAVGLCGSCGARNVGN